MSPIFLSIDTREKVSAVAYVEFLKNHPKIGKEYSPAVIEGLNAGDWAFSKGPGVHGLISFKFDDLTTSENDTSEKYYDLTGKPISHLCWELERMRRARRDHLTKSPNDAFRLALICVGQYDQVTMSRLIGLGRHYSEIYMKVAGPWGKFIGMDWLVARQMIAIDLADGFMRRWKKDDEEMDYPPGDEKRECAF
jgi:hypothetical protein